MFSHSHFGMRDPQTVQLERFTLESTMFSISLFVAVFAVVIAPQLIENSQPVQSIEKSQPRQEELRKRLPFDKNGQIKLLSCDGKWIGNDSDVMMQLHRDGKLIVRYFSFTEVIEIGIYELTKDQQIIFKLKGADPWIPMKWRLDDGKMVVRKPSRRDYFRVMQELGIDRKGLIDESYESEFGEWPFRQTVDKSAMKEADKVME